MKLDDKLILFDLDGTLTDSEEGIINTILFTFRKLGLPEPTPKEQRKFIGPPLVNNLVEVYGMSDEQAGEFAELYRQRYKAIGAFENKVYEGIPELLRDLRRKGAKLAVATSKPKTPAKLVLDHFELTPFFDYISAEDDSDKGGGKEKLILPVLEKSGIPASRAFMVGDTKFDAAGARIAGANFIGVLYGFGTRKEMEREGSTIFAETVEKLREILFDK